MVTQAVAGVGQGGRVPDPRPLTSAPRPTGIPLLGFLVLVPLSIPWGRLSAAWLGAVHYLACISPQLGSVLYHLFMNHEGGPAVYHTLLTLDMCGVCLVNTLGEQPAMGRRNRGWRGGARLRGWGRSCGGWKGSLEVRVGWVGPGGIGGSLGPGMGGVGGIRRECWWMGDHIGTMCGDIKGHWRLGARGEGRVVLGDMGERIG